ncbi:MAG: hypothetical protein QOI10_1336 [Solirubrobacterales bacterium]|jgi:hypothetical protein|nr:hypothetical protein [Solirubrobacterales bacterium]
MSRFGAWVRARPGTLAIVCLGIAWGVVMHTMGWAQLAHFAEVRSLASGETTVDRYHWETGDVAWIDGHYYSVKSPGMAAFSTPLYMLIDATGGREVAADAAANTAESRQPKWTPNDGPPYASYGYDAVRAERVQLRVEDETPVVWALTLLAAVLPSILLLLMVRRIADRLEPGYGTAAAITLGLCTILMIFAAEFFSHAISTTLAFAAFAILFAERRGPPRPWLVAAAGLLAGLAVTFEFQTGLVGAVVFFYAVARDQRLRRGLAYAAGAVAGAVPALAFNAWTLGSPFTLAYSRAVAEIGTSGHQSLGLNSNGFFGITLPRWEAVRDLLFAGRGLLVLTPVIVLALVGVVLMRRRGHRAEAWTIAGVAIAYFAYNSGYWQPFGGGTPGPRFLIPALPFVALGFGFAYRRFPTTTLALAAPSAIWMLAASLTYPLLGDQGTGDWVSQLGNGTLEHTLLSVFGLHPNWLAAIPVLLAVGGAIAFAVVATPATADAHPRDQRIALGAVAAWVVVSTVGPSISSDAITPLDGGWRSFWLIGIGAAAALAVIAQLRSRAPRPVAARPAAGSPVALGERTS